MSERSTDIDLVREAVHQKRSLRTRKASETRLSRGNSRWEKSSHSSFQKYSLREGMFAKRNSICRSTSANTSTDELDRISVVTTEERLRNIQVELLLWMDQHYKRITIMFQSIGKWELCYNPLKTSSGFRPCTPKREPERMGSAQTVARTPARRASRAGLCLTFLKKRLFHPCPSFRWGNCLSTSSWYHFL